MNLQDKINWFKINGWLETFEVEPTTIDARSFDSFGPPSKIIMENGYFIAKWDGAHTTLQYSQRGYTKNEAIENLYTFIGEHLWKCIGTISDSKREV